MAASLYARGLTAGSSGNISVRIEDGWLMTPTGSTMGTLDPARLSKLDNKGEYVSGDKPTKETFLHMAMYRQRPKAGAVVHLHSTYAVAVSCMAGLDPENVLPPLTAYHAMRIGELPLVPYIPPGDPALGEAVEAAAKDHHAVLLANHGPVVAGKSLPDAIFASEELEETAKLFLILQGVPTAPLSEEQAAEIAKRYPVGC
ncbi:ribulose-5-phosphate 4-epimerase/fuculose-1-phosphate aldolase [Shimia isoporae]|uniref:3-oxo-tetronate 4-phosphate decarboxylase n=2 Tax=Shimia isoporae TaxID=647720 RepID=A0A4V2Q3T1_9RHOB|nr:ribulose-5-phosphate 4-epimerase/fuculose-1-phosphate aldolase [Shimia isoporae]